MKKTVAIIGVTGKLGYRVANKLANQDKYDLIGIARTPGKRSFDHFKNISFYQIKGIDDIENLSYALKKADIIINTGYVWFADLIHKALQKAKHKPEQIIFIGSTAIFTRYEVPSKAKRMAGEQSVMRNFNNWTLIRPTMIYGHPQDNNISRLIKFVNKSPVIPIIGKGKNKIQPIFIDDVVEFIIRSIDNPNVINKEINIGGKRAITNRELFLTVAALLKKRRILIPIPPQIILFGIKLFRLIGQKPPVKEEQVMRFLEDKNVDISEAVQLLNYTPIDFNDGCSILIKKMRENNII